MYIIIFSKEIILFFLHTKPDKIQHFQLETSGILLFTSV